MEIVPFKPEHLLIMDLQGAQQPIRALFESKRLKFLEVLDSFTVLEDGVPLACFGWVELYPTRAVIWSALSRHAGPHMVAFTRIAKRLIDSLPHRRIEAEVDAQFPAGQRWMEMLGLRCETPIPLCGYNAEGGDAYIYAKVK